MAQIYHTISLESKDEVRLCERTTHSGLRYVIFRGSLIVGECDFFGDANRLYNKIAAL